MTENDQVNIYDSLIKSKKITFSTLITYILCVLGVMTAIFHFYTAFYGQPTVMVYRSVSFNLFLVASFLLFPLSKKPMAKQRFLTMLPDILCILFVIFIQIYILTDIDAFMDRRGDASTADIVLGSIYIFLVVEMTRRTVGITLALLILAFFFQSFLSDHFFWIFYGPPIPYSVLIENLFMQEQGIFGVPVMVMADFIYLFILFGIFLLYAGAGKFFMDLAFSITKNQVGGPAKASVLSSMLMATVSGSSGANVAVTGQFTIPLMKKAGFAKSLAGAVEAVASTGGQLMPPVMGATAFIMAYYVGGSYLHICLAAVLPSILYFLSVFIMVHFEARKVISAIDQKSVIKKAEKILIRQYYLLLPLIVVIGILFLGFSATMAALCGIITIFILSFLDKKRRIDPDRLINIFTEGLKFCIPIAIACGGVGVLIGSIYASGLGIKMGSLILSLGNQNMLLTLVVTMIVSIILGMGLPTVVVYITLSALVIPGLIDLGVNVMAAHFFCFYFGVIGCITPPVAISAFIAAGLAGSNFMKTGFVAMKIGAASYIIPYLFVRYPELLLEGGISLIVMWRFLLATLGVFSMAFSIQGFLYSRLNIFWRIFFGLISLFIFIGGNVFATIGIMGFLLALILFKIKESKKVNIKL